MKITTHDIKTQIINQVTAGRFGRVWVPADFAHLGNRDAVDKTLQRLVQAGELRRIDRGLYDRPRVSGLTKRLTSPDYREVLDALARRDQLRMLVDGMTAANDLGLTDAVPARVIVHTDARRRSIQLDNLTIEFKLTAPSRLYWAGHPAMRVVRALHWLKDMLATDRGRILTKLTKVLADPIHGAAIRYDLQEGFKTLPIWMQPVVRDLLSVNQARDANDNANDEHNRVDLASADQNPPTLRKRATSRVRSPANSGSNWTRIPRQTGQPFQSKLDSKIGM